MAAFCPADTSLDLTSIVTLTVIAGSVGVLYLVLLRYVSTILRVERAGETFKMELKSILAGAVLVVFIMMLVVPLATFISSLDASSTISGPLSDMEEAVKAISVFGAYAHDLAPFSASFSVSFLVKAGYSSAGALGALNDAFSNLSQAASTITTVWAITKVTYSLTCFLMELGAKYFLLAGIVLRMLPPFKRVGSTLVAISLGLIVALPLSFYFSNLLANTLIPTNAQLSALKSSTSLALGKVSGMVSALSGYERAFLISSMLGAAFSNPGSSGLPQPIPYAATASAKAAQFAALLPINIIAETLLSSALTNTIVNAMKAAADFSVMLGVRVTFTSFLIAFSTLGFIRSIALILGGEFFLYGIQRRI